MGAEEKEFCELEKQRESEKSEGERRKEAILMQKRGTGQLCMLHVDLHVCVMRFADLFMS